MASSSSAYPQDDKIDQEDIVHCETQEKQTGHEQPHKKTGFLSKFWQKDVDPAFVKEALDKYGEGTPGIPPELEKKLVRKLDCLILPL
jgi:hypothetical protein